MLDRSLQQIHVLSNMGLESEEAKELRCLVETQVKAPGRRRGTVQNIA